MINFEYNLTGGNNGFVIPVKNRNPVFRIFMDSASKPALSAAEWVRNDRSKSMLERVNLKKQSQFAGLWPEIRNTKL
jgi:hypothetical protein